MLQTRVGYAGGAEPEPTYHEIGGHAEAVRVIFDPALLPIDELLRQYLEHAYDGGGSLGQYRSEIFPISWEQHELARELAGRSRIPVAPPTTFWDAEAYHQKYLLRRNHRLVDVMHELLGPRWDEHAYATKLNGAGDSQERLAPWLREMPSPIVAAYKRGR